MANAPHPAGVDPWVFNVGSGRLSGLDELCVVVSRPFPWARVLYRAIPSEFDSTSPPFSVRKMAEAFGWTPRFDLAQGLSGLVEAAGA